MYILSFLLSEYENWLQHITTKKIKVFNCVTFWLSSNWLHTIPDKEGNCEKWFCPLERCGNQSQMLQTSVNCLYCNVNSAFI
jgi:hypothetical protein